ncbi:MAG: TAXI family TRAP transporter solute-binding subunit [bacterium]
MCSGLRLLRGLIVGVTVGVLGLSGVGCQKGKEVTFITIGTGGMTGVYYPVGGAMAKLINDASHQYRLKATVQSTGGSVFNINAVLKKDMEFGIAQSDLIYQAYRGEGEWAGRPQGNLRLVFNLHNEVVTLVASDKSGIWNPTDMKGKRIAIGPPGSGMRSNAIDALELAHLTLKDIQPEDVKPTECAGMLQDGRIDAYFYTVGHPNGSIKEAVAGTSPVHFVPFPNIESLLAKKPYYTKGIIPIRHYSGASNTQDVPTFGVRAALITHTDISPEVVYRLVEAVLTHWEEFRNLHPALEDLSLNDLVSVVPAPFHPGALEYFRKIGLSVSEH